jgi:hypothetical protein
MALTNFRIVAAYEKTSVRLWPPSLISGLRRSSTPIAAITAVGIRRERRAVFLVLGFATVLWYPFGSALSMAAAVLFLAVRRPVLEVSTRRGARRFPLALADLRAVVRTLNHIRSQPPGGIKKTG